MLRTGTCGFRTEFRAISTVSPPQRPRPSHAARLKPPNPLTGSSKSAQRRWKMRPAAAQSNAQPWPRLGGAATALAMRRRVQAVEGTFYSPICRKCGVKRSRNTSESARNQPAGAAVEISDAHAAWVWFKASANSCAAMALLPAYFREFFLQRFCVLMNGCVVCEEGVLGRCVGVCAGV